MDLQCKEAQNPSKVHQGNHATRTAKYRSKLIQKEIDLCLKEKYPEGGALSSIAKAIDIFAM